MSGYTPVFRSVFTGSLTGKWPDTGLWVSLLALADKNGELDYTPQFISMVTGLELHEVESCIARFMEPDPMSRTPDDDGRRLVLTSPPRAWGWRIVNFHAYRERARLSAKSAREVEEGRNRQRMEGRTAADRRSPPLTAADPLSNANANANSNTDKTRRARNRAARTCPPDFVVTPEMEAWAAMHCPGIDIHRETESFRDYTFATAKTDWPATWRNWMRKAKPSGRRLTKYEESMNELKRRSANGHTPAESPLGAFGPNVGAQVPRPVRAIAQRSVVGGAGGDQPGPGEGGAVETYPRRLPVPPDAA